MAQIQLTAKTSSGILRKQNLEMMRMIIVVMITMEKKQSSVIAAAAVAGLTRTKM